MQFKWKHDDFIDGKLMREIQSQGHKLTEYFFKERYPIFAFCSASGG